jgi:hypothetical protein
MTSKDSWSVSAADADGLPLVIRVRNIASELADKDCFPHLIGILWRYESPNASGMPSKEVEERMNHFEDVLEAALEDAGQAILTATVTGRGVREWQWYSRDTDETMSQINAALQGYQPFPIELSTQDDPRWDAYEQFQELVNA